MTADFSVRFFDLDGVTVDEALLSERERERVARKGTPALRQRQAASFQCLRVTLGEALGVGPETLAFRVEASGKPVVVEHALHFNLSHSDGVGMLAWGPRELGADIEALIARPTDGLAEEILSPRELDVWRTVPGPERQAWLTRVWTRKESTLKAAGSGLRMSPRLIDVGLAPAADAAPQDSRWTLRLSERHWHGVDAFDDVPVGYRAAVCVEAPHD